MNTQKQPRAAGEAAHTLQPYTNIQFNALPGWARDHILTLESRGNSHAALVEALEQIQVGLSAKSEAMHREAGTLGNLIDTVNEIARAAIAQALQK